MGNANVGQRDKELAGIWEPGQPINTPTHFGHVPFSFRKIPPRHLLAVRVYGCIDPKGRNSNSNAERFAASLLI